MSTETTTTVAGNGDAVAAVTAEVLNAVAKKAVVKGLVACGGALGLIAYASRQQIIAQAAMIRRSMLS